MRWSIVAGVVIICLIAVGLVVKVLSMPVKEADPLMLFVSGTEYNVGEQGQVIVEARYPNGSVATVSGGCLMRVWYPDKTLFMSEQGQTSASGSEFIEFTVPNATGIYEYQAECLMKNGKTGVTTKSFHVSEFQNETLTRLNRMRAVMTK